MASQHLVLEELSYEELIVLGAWVIRQGGEAYKVRVEGGMVEDFISRGYVALVAAHDFFGDWVYLMCKDRGDE